MTPKESQLMALCDELEAAIHREKFAQQDLRAQAMVAYRRTVRIGGELDDYKTRMQRIPRWIRRIFIQGA